MLVEVYLFKGSLVDLGDNGVLGGVGGWLGGEPPSILFGFNVKFSKILPVTKGDKHHDRLSIVNKAWLAVFIIS